MSTYRDFFFQATGREPGREPYPFQERFAEADSLPHLLRAPTGAGKTATAILGWAWRYFHGGMPTPRRLVYCLPMRVLVEQSEREARKWMTAVQPSVGVHVLMGGVEKSEWFLHPEKPAILIGTQDMLLSRALNRGYAASRFHWPIDFGLLNNDCLWVFDEPQLMANGVATSAQLAGLRESLKVIGHCPSVWMSATLEPSWLDTIDFRGKFTAPAMELTDEDYAEEDGKVNPLRKRMTAKKTISKLGVSAKEPKQIAEKLLGKKDVEGIHQSGTQTLVVCNTVDRAKAVYSELQKLKKNKPTTELLLVHSRFRPKERAALNDALQDKNPGDRILVTTQVVEAGVDISSRTLVTELAPWSSIVQRIGRCNRTGDDGPGRVYWIDLDDKLALPYEEKALAAARNHLTMLDGKDVSPKALDDFKKANETADEPFMPFEHKHVLRRRDLLDLFDTTPDLSGNDIDISRFVRSDDPDTDVQVFWRREAPDNDWDDAEARRQKPRREELCNVPIGSFKKDFLEAGKSAFRFDHLDGEWRELSKKDAGAVRPGQLYWIKTDQGGYDVQLGWNPTSGKLPDDFQIPLPVPLNPIDPEAFDGDDWSHTNWQTIASHTDDVCRELQAVLSSLPISESEKAALGIAARWHDWGKIHAVFQRAIRYEARNPLAVRTWREKGLPEPVPVPRPEKWKSTTDLAKAPDGFWARYRPPRFRHELASALGVLKLQAEGVLPPEWVALADGDRRLAIYLIAAHHGKVRLSIRSMPDESPSPDGTIRTACGVRDGDSLKATALGAGVVTPEVVLDLLPMELGGDTSWTAQALQLRERLGPFRLAWLEALLRAADCRASAMHQTEGSTDE